MPVTRSSKEGQIPVLVTGFGPFSVHSTNASWEAVKKLDDIGVDDNVDLITYEIPVVYNNVKKTIPELWSKHNPQLVVHVGVSGIATEITVERMAHNTGYRSVDVEGDLPCGNCCVPQVNGVGRQPDCVRTGLDVDLVCAAINSDRCPVTAVTSEDCGRYLCEFIYFTSLTIDPSRTVFVHVPPLMKPFTASELAVGLQLAIRNMLQQLKDRDAA